MRNKTDFIGFRITPELKSRLNDEAIKRGISLSKLIELRVRVPSAAEELADDLLFEAVRMLNESQKKGINK